MNKQIAAFSVAGLLLLTSCGPQTVSNSNAATMNTNGAMDNSSMMMNSNMDNSAMMLNSNADMMMGSNMNADMLNSNAAMMMTGTTMTNSSSTFNY